MPVRRRTETVKKRSRNVTRSSLSVKQKKALNALLETGSKTLAAEKAGVSRETVSRWFNRKPAFRRAYEQKRREYEKEADANLRDFYRLQTEDLLRVRLWIWQMIEDRKTPPTVRAGLLKVIYDRRDRGEFIGAVKERAARKLLPRLTAAQRADVEALLASMPEPTAKETAQLDRELGRLCASYGVEDLSELGSPHWLERSKPH